MKPSKSLQLQPAFILLQAIVRWATFGYFYDTSFNPSDPEANLIIEDDDSGFQLQFHIRVYLRPEHTYILVVTTHWESTTGRFSILASGPASINLVSNTEPTTLPTTIGKFLQRTLPSENSYNSAESCSQSLVFLFYFSDRRKLSFLLSITHSNCDCFRLFQYQLRQRYHPPILVHFRPIVQHIIDLMATSKVPTTMKLLTSVYSQLVITLLRVIRMSTLWVIFTSHLSIHPIR